MKVNLAKPLHSSTDLSRIHPGEILLEEFLLPGNISVEKIALRLQVSENVINDLIKGKIPVDEKIAKGLALFFGNSFEFWLNLQKSYDNSV